MSLLPKVQARAYEQKASVQWSIFGEDILDYLRNRGDENWREVFTPLIEGTIEETGTFWATQLGTRFDLRNIRAEAWFQDYVLQFAQPVNDSTAETIKEVIAQAMAEGWSVPTMQANLTTLFEQWIAGGLKPSDFEWLSSRMPPHRVEMIARTEVGRAMNTGSHKLFVEWGVTQKEWNSARDKRVRDSHARANGQIRGIDEPFIVGGYRMMHPHDLSLGASIAEIVNCRCVELPIIPE
jgi:uncharacterized protein with gpF-like domain